MHKAAGFMAGYMAGSSGNKELNKEASRNIAPGQASFLKALFPGMSIYGKGEDVTPIELHHPATRQTYKLSSNDMHIGGDANHSYS